MATLPDGTTITSQHSEGWNVEPLSGVNKIWSEGWNVALLVMQDFTCLSDPDLVTVGNTVTISGKSVLSSGNPTECKVDVTLPDGTVKTIDVNVDHNGDYSHSFETTQVGDFEAFAYNDRRGLRKTENWNVEPLTGVSLIHSEGWNNA